ncbi:unnamed protein product [Cladocopium goreaui]|uniref:Uncharacterized protein n=1 Tax=Cladocopium goreaui TaxID=2562237 RepID=A0A9P1FX59_9DINO|nr:unnamed protein product [Cladocopium goreaui]
MPKCDDTRNADTSGIAEPSVSGPEVYMGATLFPRTTECDGDSGEAYFGSDAPAGDKPMTESEKATMDTMTGAHPEVRGLSREKMVVKNMAECFDFFERAVEEVTDPDSIQDVITSGELASRLESFSISTAYSGIGAPETTLNIIHHWVQEIRGRETSGSGSKATVKAPRMVFQVEYDECCRKELLHYPSLHKDSHPCCCFGDLNGFYRPELQEVVKQLQEQPELALEILSKMVADGEAVTTRGWCYAHGKYCDMTMALLHVAGTSCTAYAACGKQQGIRDATILPFLVWIGHRLVLQEPILLHENSKRFPSWLLQRFLGHLYHIEETVAEAADFGQPARRERKLTRLVHRGKCGVPVPFDNFAARFYRSCEMTFREYYWQHLIPEAQALGFRMR